MLKPPPAQRDCHSDPMIQALKEHQEIVRSLRTGDPAKARDTAIAHLRKVAERINKAAICSANNKSSDRRDGDSASTFQGNWPGT